MPPKGGFCLLNMTYYLVAVTLAASGVFFPTHAPTSQPPSLNPNLNPATSFVLGGISASSATTIAVTQKTVAVPAFFREKIRKAWVTAYSSRQEETDDTPFITASGSEVRDGIVAANFLPFGSKIKIPAIFGEKIFIVEDRMHARKKGVVDVWMASTKDAEQFGAHLTDIAIVE